MQLAIAWREFEVSDMEDYHAVQQAGSEYAYEQAQANTSTKSSKSDGDSKSAAKAVSSLTTPAGGYTPTTFARALLSALGAPATTANMSSLTTWEGREGGAWANTARFNPLNTTAVAVGLQRLRARQVRAGLHELAAGPAGDGADPQLQRLHTRSCPR